ncbi:MAG: hypothetical protein ACLT74_05495 [Christensenellales bacterium]
MCGSCAYAAAGAAVRGVLRLPSLGIILDPFPAAVIVFSINEGAYCAGDDARGAGIRVGADGSGLLRGMSYGG